MSDRTGQRPKGTMVRPAPDWFSDNLYVGGFQVIGPAAPPGNSHWITVALFNNDQMGRVCRVYGIYALTDGGGGMGLYFTQGTIGAKFGNVNALRPDRAAPDVEIWQQVQSTASDIVSPFSLGPQFGVVPCSGFDSDFTAPGFPLAIVPQGYSLIASNLIGSGSTGAAFWCQMATQ